jgi:phosphonate transport system substrate-binding protein
MTALFLHSIRPWAALIALLAVASCIHAAPATYTIAVVPQFKAQQLQQEWRPLLDRIGAKLDARFEMRFYASIPDFESGFLKGETDFIFMNPYHAVMARKAQGYIPLLRDRKPLTGILVVAGSGPVRKISDLEGKKLAFPAPNAFGASLYMRAYLTEVAKIRFEPVFVKTHANVYRQVLLGDVAAGGGVNQTFNDLPEEMRAGLRILHETANAAPHPLAAHPRVPSEFRRALRQAFIGLTETPEGRAMLKEMRMPDPIEADYDRDYRPLDSLRLEKYVVLE